MAKKRTALSKKTRFEVFKRDGFVCQYCGGHPPEAILHVDHIHPVADGGKNHPDNLLTACDSCNMGKGATSLAKIPVSLADRAAQIAEKEAQIRGYSDVMWAQRERIESDAWAVADIFCEHFSIDSIRKDWFLSIKQFIEKIGVHECMRAMELAVARRIASREPMFRYFCGICWNIAKDSHS